MTDHYPLARRTPLRRIKIETRKDPRPDAPRYRSEVMIQHMSAPGDPFWAVVYATDWLPDVWSAENAALDWMADAIGGPVAAH